MSIPEDTQLIYEHLAQQCEQRQETLQRDQFLLLAADSAHTLGREGQAHRLHRQLLQFSPSTMLRPFASFAEALGSSDVRAYVFDLRQQYPPETAAQMLEAGSECSLSTDLFSDTVDSDMDVPLSESNPFGNGKAAAQVLPRRNSQPWTDMPPPAKPSLPPSTDEKQRRRSTPSLHLSASPTPAAADVPIPPAVPSAVPTLPVRPRRRSPYEDPDYGPKVPPPSAKADADDAGIWFIHVLAGLLGLAGIGALAYVFVRPFLAR